MNKGGTAMIRPLHGQTVQRVFCCKQNLAGVIQQYGGISF